MRQLDIELVPALAERQTRLRGVEAHDHAGSVLEPQFAVRLGGDGETTRALDPGAGELGDVVELVHLAGGLQRRDRAKAERASRSV